MVMISDSWVFRCTFLEAFCHSFQLCSSFFTAVVSSSWYQTKVSLHPNVEMDSRAESPTCEKQFCCFRRRLPPRSDHCEGGNTNKIYKQSSSLKNFVLQLGRCLLALVFCCTAECLKKTCFKISFVSLIKSGLLLKIFLIQTIRKLLKKGEQVEVFLMQNFASVLFFNWCWNFFLNFF